MERFKTKTVVITGAGSGLGRGFALDFARRGWNVAISDINMAGAGETKRLMNGKGRGLIVKCDVTKHEDVKALADAVISEWGSVDIIINNAGVPVAGVMEHVSLEDWRFEIDIMLMSVIYGCRVFIPIFKKQGRGHIVNVASAAGIVSLPEMAPYNATKAGVISLSETLRSELKASNIGVTVVCPTFFKTNLMEHARFSDVHTKNLAQAYFDKLSFGSVASVERATLKAIKKNKLYVFPQLDSKFHWFMKRMLPNTFYNFHGFIFKQGILDRLLGVRSK